MARTLLREVGSGPSCLEQRLYAAALARDLGRAWGLNGVDGRIRTV